MDALDTALLRLLLEEPRAGMREYARVLGIARGTVQARLARLEREGVIAGYGPRLQPSGLGYPVLAWVNLHLAQGRLDEVVGLIERMPEALEAHTIAGGEGDLMCRVVARDNAHLEEVIQQLLRMPGVVRTQTQIVLRERVRHRMLPLVAQLDRRSAAPDR
ncbi:AsnC family transcriptional regulator [Actinocorallia herbida]|uniref:AsnC family transcriptional regulator n=1 Tax=Actinocorallia herbida TaxID=58109 RepID=A0A3N1D3B3_9ACTN|nr:Lrp/AsnC family transcriptional regulator [Actinocorallia herbida]ROO88011.1 AsnC family transcriptional regulator [Actinocorallia herbida]